MSIVQNKCYSDIIGLTRKNIEIAGYKTEFTNSKSDLFIDELQGIVINDQCDTTIWDKMQRSIDNAFAELRMSVAIEMNKYYEQKRKQINTSIGSIDFLNKIKTGKYAGLQWFSNVKGATALIKKITILPNSNEPIDLVIMHNNETIYTDTILNAISKKPLIHTLETPILLKLDGSTSFLYSTNNESYTTNLGCCGDSAYYNEIMPKYQLNSSKPWKAYVMGIGVHGDDVYNLNKVSGKSLGVKIDVEFNCSNYDLLCNESSDFINNDIDRAIAFALLYKTGEFFLNEIVSGGEVNRFVLLSFEAIENLTSYYIERFNVMVEYIATNINIENNGCLACKEKYNVTNRFV